MAQSQEYSVDVLVVGSGGGGMTAALAAVDAGLTTLIIEKSLVYGGSTAMSGGAIWIPNNHLMKKVGLSDSVEEGLVYLKAITKGVVSEARLRAYVEAGAEMVKYLEEHSRVRFQVVPGYSDYYPGVAGSKAEGGRTIEPVPFSAWKLGPERRLMRPLHPLHADLSFFAGWKFVVIVLWLPLAAFLAWIFKPDLQPTLLEGVAFFVAIWGAYLIRTMLLTLLGLITFWTTRVGAIFELFFAVELVISGRLVPMSLMPEWVQRVAAFFPFQWTFGFPIEALVSQMSPVELLRGLGVQLLWIVIGFVCVKVLWRFAIKQFSAVGG